MVLKDMLKKVVILGVFFGVAASPLALAHTSIQLNQERIAGNEIIKPTSSNSSGRADFSARDLVNDRNNTQDYSSSSNRDYSEEQQKRRSPSYRTGDLTRDEGDSLQW